MINIPSATGILSGLSLILCCNRGNKPHSYEAITLKKQLEHVKQEHNQSLTHQEKGLPSKQNYIAEPDRLPPLNFARASLKAAQVLSKGPTRYNLDTVTTQKNDRKNTLNSTEGSHKSRRNSRIFKAHRGLVKVKSSKPFSDTALVKDGAKKSYKGKVTPLLAQVISIIKTRKKPNFKPIESASDPRFTIS